MTCKKIIAFILVLALALSLVACGEVSAKSSEAGRFVIVEKDTWVIRDYGYTIVDTESGVMYLRITHGNVSGITVLLNADGTPMLHPDYVK